MRKNSFFLVLTLSLGLSISAWGNVINLPIQKVGSTNFYIYKVPKKETVYSICKALNITKDDILKYNPSVADGLKAGQTLFFPVNDFKVEPTDVNSTINKSFNHVVERGETLYGISKMYNVSPDAIIALNPSANESIKAGQNLIIPQKNSSPTISTSPTDNIVFYTIKKGDTLFSLAKRYSTTVDDILKLNPGVTPSNFKSDEVIRITPNTYQEPVVEIATPEFRSYEAKKGESLYSIARNNNISVEELSAANADLKSVKAGAIINIPQNVSVVEEPAPKNEDLIEPLSSMYNTINGITESDTIRVALVLPYMLNEIKPNKQARLYTEFYKGFLLAVDSIGKMNDRKIIISTYDTEDSLDKVASIMNSPEMKKMNLIIAPDNANQLKLISDFGKNNDVNVVNIFSVKNDLFLDNDRLFQVNIPHATMSSQLTADLREIFSDRVPIFLTMEGNNEEKEIVVEYKKYLNYNNIPYQEITFQDNLSDADLEAQLLSLDKFIFIPTSSSKSMVSKINITLKKLKEERTDFDFVVLGYPEWTTYLYEYEKSFHKWDTYIYSRFFANPKDSSIENFNDLFAKWYGNSIIPAAPQFGILGFDTGMYFLEEISRNNNDFNKSTGHYNGLQNDFKFERINNWGGFVNNTFYIVHFSPDNTIEKIVR